MTAQRRPVCRKCAICHKGLVRLVGDSNTIQRDLQLVQLFSSEVGGNDIKRMTRTTMKPRACGRLLSLTWESKPCAAVLVGLEQVAGQPDGTTKVYHVSAH